MDRMATTDVAANQFRMTQTREKLARDGVRTEQRAIQTHEQVGKEVRAAIRRIGGTAPENIPPAEPIKEVEKRLAAGHAKAGARRPRRQRAARRGAAGGEPGQLEAVGGDAPEG